MSATTQLPEQARLWVYPATRALTEPEANTVKAQATAFVQQWAAHGQQLMADALLLHDRFLVLIVDESQKEASGCSIDSSVHFVRQLAAQIGVDFFDRMVFHYQDEQGNVNSLSRADFKAAYAKGDINDNSIVFDPLVKTVGELSGSFKKKLSDSWHARMV